MEDAGLLSRSDSVKGSRAFENPTIEVRGWAFDLGQCVSHKDRPMPSLVLGRVRTTKYREIYGVRSFADVDPWRDRMITGECLVNVVPGSEPCQSCLLFNTSLCPMRAPS